MGFRYLPGQIAVYGEWLYLPCGESQGQNSVLCLLGPDRVDLTRDMLIIIQHKWKAAFIDIPLIYCDSKKQGRGVRAQDNDQYTSHEAWPW
jgi:hypothetical protein